MRTHQPDSEVLSEADCLRLLRSAPFGRIVYTSAAMPAVQPVNFLVHKCAVIVRTGSESKLVAATSGGVVAFQADDIDTQSRAGWSITVVGRSHEVLDPNELAELARAGPVAWGNPGASRFIAIGIEQITGRWLHSPAGAVS